MDLSSALTLLYPFRGKRMKTLEITRVNPGYEFVAGTTKAVIVTRGMMRYLQRICVSTLILAENGIVDFEPKSILFHNYPHCFENIVLTGNRFSFIDGFKLKELMTLSRQLFNLTLFYFSYNPLLYENIKYPIKLPHECLLSQDESFTDRDLKRYKQRIAFNNTTVPMHEVLSENTVFFSLPPKLQKLRLTNYLSDQRSIKHIIFMNASKLRHLDVSYFDENNFPKISVHGPFNIDYIDFSGITSWRKSIELFKNSKTVVLNNLNISPLAQRHEHFFSFIAEVEKLDISTNNLWQLRKDTFSRNKKLTSFIITPNLFSELPTALTEIPKLTYLDARINIIDTINETMRNWFDKRQAKSGSFHLLLHGNVFRCTCETIDFLQWISTTKVTFDECEFMCTLSNGSVITTTRVLNDLHRLFRSCNSEIWLRVGIGLLVSFVVCVIPIPIVVNFKWQITYWLFKKFRKIVQKEMKQKVTYNMYVSYCDDTLYWVKNVLLPKLEVSWQMKTCVEDRDILAGEICADAISDSIAQSRNIIFVITDAFAHKQWGKFEIERAKYEKYTRNLQHIIVIAKDLSVENVPVQFASIWKDIVFIHWSDDENGWDRLRMVLFSGLI